MGTGAERTVAVIGLGSMGLGMASSLLRAGISVTGMGRDDGAAVGRLIAKTTGLDLPGMHPAPGRQPE